MLLMRRPDFKYLIYCTNKEEVKTKFKELALQFHPDRGGDVSAMQQLNAEYQYINKVNPILPIAVVRTTYSAPPPRPEPKRPTPPPPPVINVLEWDLFKSIIDTMLLQIRSMKKSEGSLWFNFLDMLMTSNLKTNRRQLEYIAIVLKYRSGWAFYKEKELKEKGLIA